MPDTVWKHHPHYGLIRELEASSLGSNALSYQVERSLDGWQWVGKGYEQHRGTGEVKRFNDETRPVPTACTTSTDAAIDLVVSHYGAGAWAIIRSAIENWKTHDPRVSMRFSLPLAICIEALKRDEEGDC